MAPATIHQHPAAKAATLQPLDLIYGLVNALGGDADASDPAAVAWSKELDAVLAFIEANGGRDPYAVNPRAALAAFAEIAQHAGRVAASEIRGAA